MTAARADRQDAGPGIPLGCDLGVVAGFLDRWAEPAATRHLLVSILPDTRHPQGKTFDWPSDRATALRWIEGNVPRCGLYWTVNVCRLEPHEEGLEGDVRVLRGIWADLDPLDDPKLGDKRRRPWAAERERLYALARELEHQYLPADRDPRQRQRHPGRSGAWLTRSRPTRSTSRRSSSSAGGSSAALGGVENTCNIDRDSEAARHGQLAQRQEARAGPRASTDRHHL